MSQTIGACILWKNYSKVLQERILQFLELSVKKNIFDIIKWFLSDIQGIFKWFINSPSYELFKLHKKVNSYNMIKILRPLCNVTSKKNQRKASKKAHEKCRDLFEEEKNKKQNIIENNIKAFFSTDTIYTFSNKNLQILIYLNVPGIPFKEPLQNSW